MPLEALSQFVEIPWQQLSKEALAGVIEDFVSREGTEYGVQEVTMARKVEEVIGQLTRGEVVITYDPELETATIQPKNRG